MPPFPYRSWSCLLWRKRGNGSRVWCWLESRRAWDGSNGPEGAQKDFWRRYNNCWEPVKAERQCSDNRDSFVWRILYSGQNHGPSYRAASWYAFFLNSPPMPNWGSLACQAQLLKKLSKKKKKKKKDTEKEAKSLVCLYWLVMFILSAPWTISTEDPCKDQQPHKADFPILLILLFLLLV